MNTASLDSALPVHELFSADYLEYYRMLPLSLSDGTLRVAQAGEPHAEAHEDLCRTFQATVELVPVDESELRDAIRRHFSAQESVVELVRDLAQPGDDAGDDSAALLADARDLAAQPPVIRFVNLLIRDAHAAGASDLHLEATRQGLRVRARVDGVLQELPSPPTRLQAAVVSRLKLLAELDISERRRPQDGRIRVRLESRELDLRVSTIPTLFGESVALRVAARSRRLWQYAQLEFSAERELAQTGSSALAAAKLGSGMRLAADASEQAMRHDGLMLGALGGMAYDVATSRSVLELLPGVSTFYAIRDARVACRGR